MKKTTILFICALFCWSMAMGCCVRNTSEENGLLDKAVPKYQLFPTQNMWTFIKLNTQDGTMYMLQFDVKGNNRFEIPLSLKPRALSVERNNGRFTLYPTQNIYNFILLDQVDGRTWQVQWSTNPENVGVIPISGE